MNSIKLLKAYDYLTKYKFDFTQLNSIEQTKITFFKSINKFEEHEEHKFFIRCSSLNTSCDGCIFKCSSPKYKNYCVLSFTSGSDDTLGIDEIVRNVATLLGIDDLKNEFIKWQEDNKRYEKY